MANTSTPSTKLKKCILCGKGPVVQNHLKVDACRTCMDRALRHGLEAMGYSAGVYLSLTGVWTPEAVEKAGFKLNQSATSTTKSKPVKKKKAVPGSPFYTIRRRHERATLLATQRGNGGHVVTQQVSAPRPPDQPIPELVAYAASLPPVFEKPKRQPITATMDA